MKIVRGSDFDWTEPYSLVGEFIANFEWICWSLRQDAQGILQWYGLNNWQLSEILLNQRAFTAEPLFECYASMVAQVCDEDSEAVRNCSAVRAKFKRLVRIRNDIVHGSHLYGPTVVTVSGESTQRPDVRIEKRNPDAKGARTTQVVESVEQLRRHIAFAKLVRAEVGRWSKLAFMTATMPCADAVRAGEE